MRKVLKLHIFNCEDKLINVINALWFLAFMFIFNGILVIPYILEDKRLQEATMQPHFTTKDMVVPLPENDWISELSNPVIAQPQAITKAYELKNVWENIDLHYTGMNTEYLGVYFITAYSDEETYYRYTASGTEVHYSDAWNEPTTCAIDLNYHDFGELLLIDGKLYITEDTGAFRGLWVDCFVETMEEVRAFDTRYTEVYSVSYAEYRVSPIQRKKMHEILNYYIQEPDAHNLIPPLELD